MLNIENLNVFYDGLQALYTVSLEIQEEEFVCISGSERRGKIHAASDRRRHAGSGSRNDIFQ